VGETGGADLASVWSVATVRDEVDAHLTLGGFDGRVGLAGGDGVALGEDLHGVSTGEEGDEDKDEARLSSAWLTLKWWMSDSMLSFIEARGGGTILWSSVLTAPVGILFRH
jgi:hypothetical protein